MTENYRPRIVILMPFTDLSLEQEREVREVSVAIAKTCTAAGYDPYLPWSTDYQSDPRTAPTGEAFRAEKERVLAAQLVVFIDAAGSTGAGRLLQVADENLIPVVYVRPRECAISRVGRGESHLIDSGGEIIFDTPQDIPAPLRKILDSLRSSLDLRRATWPARTVPPACAERIRRARERLGMTREFLARKLGLGVGFITNVEEGRIVPSLFALRVLAEGLGVPPSSLMHPGFTPSSKLEEDPVIAGFFMKHNLGMRHYVEFRRAYDNRKRKGTSTHPPTENELWMLYRELFGRRH
jgi:transcriptional regulator with XRE-family HTH domain